MTTTDVIERKPLLSGIYQGVIKHTRYHQKKHHFNYGISMLSLDLDELATMDYGRLFNWKKWALLFFNSKDYLSHISNIPDDKSIGNPILKLKYKVLSTVENIYNAQEKADSNDKLILCDKVIFAGQIRHFGIYFSPVNFFFCYHDNKAQYLLAEVSNTPWNQRHCYLINLNHQMTTQKAFHVSPFMNMDMSYKWHIKPPTEKLNVCIESVNQERLFSAWLSLSRKELNKGSLTKMLLHFPFMTITIFTGIYWQALKLFLKGVSFVAYQSKKENSQCHQTQQQKDSTANKKN